jgi:hypothetical protein
MVFFRTEDGIVVPTVTAEQMREVDRIAVEEFGLSILQMMENAGRNLALNVMDMLDSARACPEQSRRALSKVEGVRSPSWRERVATAVGASAVPGIFTIVVSRSGWCSTGIRECCGGLPPINSTSSRRPVCSRRIPPGLAS